MLTRQPNLQLYMKRWLLLLWWWNFIWPNWGPELAWELWSTVTGRSGYSEKKRSKYKKNWLWNERVGYRRKQKKSGNLFPKLLCRVNAVEVVNWFLNITRSWSPYAVVLRILSLCHLEFLVESWITNIKSFLQIYMSKRIITMNMLKTTRMKVIVSPM